MWTVGVDGGLLVDKLFDIFAISENHGSARTEFKAEYTTVLFSPFSEGQVRALGWNLVEVADNWERRWSGRKCLGASTNEEKGIDEEGNKRKDRSKDEKGWHVG